MHVGWDVGHDERHGRADVAGVAGVAGVTGRSAGMHSYNVAHCK